MGQRSIPAPFLTKTYELIDEESTNDVISWGTEEGSTFIVWKTAEFAKDLLPKYFKHNNFSSFVRQLNTYGFRKIVPDKWEFANDDFKRGKKELLSQIRRRKTTPVAGKIPATGGSQSISGDDVGSTSTSSPGSVEIADLSGENERLKRDNEMLSSELEQTKKQCEELIGFLTAHLNVGPEQINNILRQGVVGDVACGSLEDEFVGDGDYSGDDVNNDDDDKKEGLKLFGVWLKEVGGIENGNKRGRCYDFQGDNNSKLGLSMAQCRQKIMKI